MHTKVALEWISPVEGMWLGWMNAYEKGIIKLSHHYPNHVQLGQHAKPSISNKDA